MQEMTKIVAGILIPFLGTTLGAGMVFFFKKEIPRKIEKLFLGFASGVMIAASIWSLLLPSIEMAQEAEKIAWVPATIGFLLGILFLLILDQVLPHLHLNTEQPEGVKTSLKKTTMLLLAVTLHNIPEGMAVGVVFAGMLAQNTKIVLTEAMVLSLGIAIQNFPEGAIISLPLKGEGWKGKRAFLYGMLSGIVEPIAAGITLLITAKIVGILPYLLAFAAGAMIYVVVEELIPESQQGQHSNIGTIGVAFGFVLMMILDIALG